jgi:peptide/nickel transport system permease protein
LFWYPGFFIVSIALSINFIGDGLRDAFDPRQKRKITKKEKQNARAIARNQA